MLKIITDSASDMPQYIVERFNLHVIPTPVVIDGVDYLDGATIHTKEFYEILDDVSRDIKTYHINPAMFEEAFRPYAEHNDSVIYLCFSTGIAGTFNAANIAKQNILEDYPDFDLTIVDSKSAAIGFVRWISGINLTAQRRAERQVLREKHSLQTFGTFKNTAFRTIYIFPIPIYNDARVKKSKPT